MTLQDMRTKADQLEAEAAPLIVSNKDADRIVGEVKLQRADLLRTQADAIAEFRILRTGKESAI